LRIGRIACGFWLVERGELMVNRGDLCGSCVVIFGVENFSIFEDLFSIRTEPGVRVFRTERAG
jgi:hypothetical protein